MAFNRRINPGIPNGPTTRKVRSTSLGLIFMEPSRSPACSTPRTSALVSATAVTCHPIGLPGIRTISIHNRRAPSSLPAMATASRPGSPAMISAMRLVSAGVARRIARSSMMW